LRFFADFKANYLKFLTNNNTLAKIVHSTGTLWQTNYFEATINKIDTQTGNITDFPIYRFGFTFTPTGLAFEPTTSTAVPEPFTIIGTLIGGTAAFRMRKKLKAIKN
jgi:hypothetical protein